MHNFSVESGKRRSGMQCEASTLVHFRNRIAPSGAEQMPIELHGDKAKEKVVVEKTSQEINITYPTHTKLAAKIVRGGNQIAPEFRANCSKASRIATRTPAQERSAEGQKGVASLENNRLARGSATRQRALCSCL